MSTEPLRPLEYETASDSSWPGILKAVVLVCLITGLSRVTSMGYQVMTAMGYGVTVQGSSLMTNLFYLLLLLPTTGGGVLLTAGAVGGLSGRSWAYRLMLIGLWIIAGGSLVMGLLSPVPLLNSGFMQGQMFMRMVLIGQSLVGMLGSLAHIGLLLYLITRRPIRMMLEAKKMS